MRGQGHRFLGICAGLLGLLAPGTAAAGTAAGGTAALPLYRIEATLSLDPPRIGGKATVEFSNPTAQPLDRIVLVLFPNRFAAPDPTVTDVNRPYIWYREAFSPGAMHVEAVRIDGQAAQTRPLVASDLAARCFLEVLPAHPVPPGGRVVLTADFVTTIPQRYGTFGVADGMLTALGGWYPAVAALEPDGSWATEMLPRVADYDLTLRVPDDNDVLVNGRYFPAPRGEIHTHVSAVHALTLVAAPDLRRDDVIAGNTRLSLFSRSPSLTYRLGLGVGPDPHTVTLDALRNIVANPPPGTPPFPRSLAVVEVPLRWELTAQGDGMVAISDRTLHVFPLLHPFHDRELARAVYAEVLRSTLAAREPTRDFVWVREGEAHLLAERYRKQIYPTTRTTREWIDLFNFFAIVDRFETAPKMPFAETLFDSVPEVDQVRDRFTTFNNALPPGHVIFGKLHLELGDRDFEQTIDRCLASPHPFRHCTASASGLRLDEFYEQWVQPYPKLNYSIADFRTAHDPAGGYAGELVLRRRSSRPIREPVPVTVRTLGGEPLRLTWDGVGDTGRLRIASVARPWQAVIDPGQRLLETSRADNARPPIAQVVLDSATVDVSSTEFAIAGLVVARGRYDYTKDLALAGFYTNRGIGAALGPRLHWGPQNDPNTYRHNLYAFYGIESLDPGFRDRQNPSLRTAGHVNTLGARYDYTTVQTLNNPTQSARGRLFLDWFDTAIGSNFDYVRFGAAAGFTHPVLTHRTVVAAEVVNGFIEPTGSTAVPLQGLFSLGGSLSIRGIGAEEELARNIFLLRTEVRQTIYPEIDLSFFDLIVLRRSQLRLFVDTGQVSNSAGRIYDPTGYAVGVGIGVAAMYEVMGFFPHVAYLEFATEAHGPGSTGGLQVLFGTRQSF